MSFNELSWVDFLKRKSKYIGDDCALVKLGTEKMLLKSDLFIEDVHFKRKEISFKNIGKRAVLRVLSDIAACAGRPKYVGISCGVPNNIGGKELKKILSGVLELSDKYHFSLVGGDTSKADKLFLDIWAIGLVDKFISRKSAKVGDYIFVTGKIGYLNFNDIFKPRIKEARYLAKNFKVNSMIDVTDGFILDLYRILKESNKGAFLRYEDIPLKKETDLYRGEDYELIFTVSKNDKNIEKLKEKFYCVGQVKEKGYGYKIKKNNKERKVDIRGYLHL